MTSWRRRLPRGFQLVLAGILLLYVAKLAFDVRGRIAYPWDILTCFETPFLNSMLKLHSGQSIYGPPELGNSEIYPPGVHYITYALLKPFGAEIDIRWNRFVAVLLSLLSASVVTSCAVTLLRRLRPERVLAPWMWPALWVSFVLMLHKSMTSDQPHPDNLHILHAVVALALVVTTLERPSFGRALVTVAWAALGVFTKQTAMLAPLAILGALWLGARWSRGQLAVLSLLTMVLPLLGVAWIARGFGYDHVFQAMAGHPFINVFFFAVEPLLDGGKLSPLYFPPRPLLVLLTPVAVAFAFGEKHARPWLLAWGAIGVFEVAPALLALIKVGGNFNNLGIIDVWLLLLVLPVSWCVYDDLRVSESVLWRSPAAVLAAMILLALTLSLYPLKFRPHADAVAFGHEVENRVRASLTAGERVWMPTGLMFLVRAGHTEPVEDLSINIWTAEQGGDRRLQIHERLASRFYSRVYLLFPWELNEKKELDRHYQVVDRVPGVAAYGWHKDHRGIQPYLTAGCDILIPRAGGLRRS